MPQLRPRAHISICHFISLGLILLLTACATTEAPSQALTPDKVAGTISSPRLLEYDWMSIAEWHKMHAEDVAIAQQGEANLLFVGDSITAGWDWAFWEKYFAPYGAANFGIGGDHTGNMLWRLEHGTIGKLQPKVIVLLAGVNNFGHLHETPEQTFAGVSALVNKLRTAFPNSKILLNAVFPYGQAANTPERAQVKALNQQLATLDDQSQVFFYDYGNLFLADDGTITTDIMGDFLHLTPKGYQLWGKAMLPNLQTWLATTKLPSLTTNSQ